MKKSRKDLELRLEKIFENIATDVDVCNDIYDLTKENYNVPKGLASDLVCLRVSMSETSEFVLFTLLDSTIKVGKINIQLSDYYTDQEITQYKISKYEINKIRFPLRLKMIQIEEDQWIGSIDVTLLMKFRAAQLINYNVNAQRTLKKIIRGDNEVYKITLNQKAISSIKQNFQSNLFIPNTLTFNIPLDSDSDFYYDKEKCELVVKKLNSFDIIDGYHRYIAACKASDEDPSFNYKLELRVVNFSEDKAKTFIYQEDQKTKMRKIDSDSLNMNNAANIVVTRLNENPRCNIQGLIGRNGGIINFAELAELIRFFYFKNRIRKEEEKKLIISTVKELTECFNLLTEYDLKYLTEKYSYKELVIIIYMYYLYKDKNKDNMCEHIEKVLSLKDDIDNKKFYNKIPRKSMINDINKIIEVVNFNV